MNGIHHSEIGKGKNTLKWMQIFDVDFPERERYYFCMSGLNLHADRRPDDSPEVMEEMTAYYKKEKNKKEFEVAYKKRGERNKKFDQKIEMVRTVSGEHRSFGVIKGRQADVDAFITGIKNGDMAKYAGLLLKNPISINRFDVLDNPNERDDWEAVVEKENQVANDLFKDEDVNSFREEYDLPKDEFSDDEVNKFGARVYGKAAVEMNVGSVGVFREVFGEDLGGAFLDSAIENNLKGKELIIKDEEKQLKWVKVMEGSDGAINRYYRIEITKDGQKGDVSENGITMDGQFAFIEA